MAAIIRKGMWAVSSGRVGIVNALGRNAVEFHEVATAEIKDDLGNVIANPGETIGVHQVPYAGIAQAAYFDIPENRRPTEDVAIQLGYLAG